MQSPSSSYTATLPLSVLHLCHKKNSFVDPHASHWPVPPPQPLPSSIVSFSYITSCASHLPHYLQPVLPSKPINYFKPFPCLGVHVWVQNTSLQIVTEQHWLSRPIHTWSSPQRTRSASWKTCKCSLNVMDFCMVSALTSPYSVLNSISSRLSWSHHPLLRLRLLVISHRFLLLNLPLLQPESPLFPLQSIWAPVAASYSNVL